MKLPHSRQVILLRDLFAEMGHIERLHTMAAKRCNRERSHRVLHDLF
jgi:hypothetical protein